MRRLFVILNCVVVAAAAIVLIPAFALADVPSSYTSYGYATGVHAIGSSDAFPNFQNGAVNNRYPMAEVSQDASPSSAATATYSDSGPAAATAGSQYNQSCSGSGSTPPPPQMCENPNNSVPYARATSPGPSHGHVDACNGCGQGSSADADAGELTATSSAFYAGGGTQPFTGASGRSVTVVDSGGTLTVTTHSEVDSFTLGTVHVSKITVDVTASSSMSGGGGDAHITGGQVTANGQPVAVGDQGVTIADKTVSPCPPALPAPPVNPPALPTPGGLPTLPPVGRGAGAVAACTPAADLTYIQIFTVAPQKSVDQGHVTIWATGLHVKVTHPSPGPGVPTQTAEYVLGEGFADLQVGSGGAAFGFGGFGSGDFGGGDFGGFGSGDQGAGGGLGGPNSPAGQIGAALAASRVPLAWMFLTLEALLLASAAAWIWARNAPAEKVPDEVLSP
ncbi:MAG TPA: hypothetical protein VFL27_09225 [Candidatus Dormibacteraeota bacterium]|nr:hypothetical protein [Candidatus Dormibacteraeota bacterium]